MHFFSSQTVVIVPLLLGAATPVAAAQLVQDNSGNPTGPGSSSSTDQLDFADVDLDGDWDVGFANGPTVSLERNRLWINQGGLQGGVQGTFTDETAPRLPLQVNFTRDLEFADIDADGDPDLYVVNYSGLIFEGSRWWINQGGSQGQTLGFFGDETAGRWIGLGQPGSSIPPSGLQDDTWIGWGIDASFADFDNDGDLDLIHATSETEGDVVSPPDRIPSRLFLNDGSGRFEEFNPGGAQLPGPAMIDGVPALWAEGVQQEGANDTSGQFTDIAGNVIKVSVGDLDGDFDIDLILGSRPGGGPPGPVAAPRYFENRQDIVGSLSFRDVTFSKYETPPSLNLIGTYGQELGDLDGDGDLDLYGINWTGFNDRTHRNDGTGFMNVLQGSIGGSQNDDDDADLGDFDGDGDLDVFVAEFGGPGRVFGNDGSGLLTLLQVIPGSGINTDADVTDIDGDGDYDVMLARGFNQFNPNVTLINQANQADTTAPFIPAVENSGDRVAAIGSVVVRAQAYDNAPEHVLWENETRLEVEVDSVPIGDFSMASSRGQIFRGTLPANLVGSVTYRVHCTDAYSNSGVSADEAYLATSPLSFQSTFGLGTPGQAGSPTLAAASVPFAGATLYLTGTGVSDGATYFVYLTDAGLPSPLALPGLANVNVTGNVLALLIGLAGPGDTLVEEVPIGPTVPAGITVFGQVFATDGSSGNLLSSSAGLELVTQ